MYSLMIIVMTHLLTQLLHLKLTYIKTNDDNSNNNNNK